jgi:hypothetical protein
MEPVVSALCNLHRGYLWNKGRKRHVKTLDVLLRFGANVNQYNNVRIRLLVHIVFIGIYLILMGGAAFSLQNSWSKHRCTWRAIAI